MEQRRKARPRRRRRKGLSALAIFVIILCVLVLAVGAFILFITRAPQIGPATPTPSGTSMIVSEMPVTVNVGDILTGYRLHVFQTQEGSDIADDYYVTGAEEINVPSQESEEHRYDGNLRYGSIMDTSGILMKGLSDTTKQIFSALSSGEDPWLSADEEVTVLLTVQNARLSMLNSLTDDMKQAIQDAGFEHANVIVLLISQEPNSAVQTLADENFSTYGKALLCSLIADASNGTIEAGDIIDTSLDNILTVAQENDIDLDSLIEESNKKEDEVIAAATSAPVVTNPPEATLAPVPTDAPARTVMNYLLIGYDRDSSRDATYSVFRTDTLMLVSIYYTDDLKSFKEVKITSIPRDSYVPIIVDNAPVRNADGTVRQDKINSVLSWTKIKCGSDNEKYLATRYQNLCDTVSFLMGGVTIDGYFSIDMDLFVEVVDMMTDGGVWFDVDRNIYRVGEDGKLTSEILIPKGRQQLDGEKALILMRDRYNTPAGDLTRVDRQRKFLLEAFQQIKPTTLSQYWTLIANYESIMEKVETNLSVDRIGNLIWNAAQLDASLLGGRQIKTGGYYTGGIWYQVVDQLDRINLVKELFGKEISTEIGYWKY